MHLIDLIFERADFPAQIVGVTIGNSAIETQPE
jgi:hypothetical protein